MAGLNDVLADIGTYLAAIGPFNIGGKFKDENNSPPRFIVRTVSTKASAPTTVGGNPKSLADDLHTVIVECWGADFAAAEDMRQALVSAARTTMRGANVGIGSAVWNDPEWSEDGYVCKQTLIIRMPLPQISMPVASALGVNNTYPTQVVTPVPDNTGTAHDNKLDWNET